MDIPKFLAGDIIFFAEEGDLYGKVGSWLMRSRGEQPTYAVHTAHFIDPYRVLEMDFVTRVKSFSAVLNRRYRFDKEKYRAFEVWRNHKLTPHQRKALTEQSLGYLDVKFGLLKFGAHLLDDIAGKFIHRKVIFFRRLDPSNHNPVCSGITVAVYSRSLRYSFGVDPQSADPDDIYDWVTSHPKEWMLVFQRVPNSQNLGD